MTETRYRVNTPTVSSQTLDGEALIIHFENGCYFATEGTGAAIWDRVENGYTEREIVEELAARQELTPSTIAAGVAAFVQQLIAEDLIRPREAVGGKWLPLPSKATGAQVSYAEPVLEKHSELGDLLKLDPMHDVDDTGWPLADRGEPQA